VVNARTWFTLFIISFGTVAATASCGSDEATGGGGGAGSIISGGGRAGSTGRAGSGGGTSATGISLGTTCATDAQCADGLICVKAGSGLFGGTGPSNGMCTMPCQFGGSECGAIKAGSQCFPFGTDDDPESYCLEACELGAPADVSAKCSGRADFVCVDVGVDDIVPLCLPHCRSDAECGTGLFCDKTSVLGLCSKTKHTGDPIGSECDPESDTNTCEAFCVRTSDDGVTPVTGICIELCSGGSECAYGSGTKPVPGGFCGGKFSAASSVIDVGYCLPNCSCTGDCTMPGDLCRKWPAADADLADALGAPGVCFPNVTQTVELTCGEGGAGGAGGSSGAGGDGSSGAGGDSAPGAGGVAGSN
jgi:hypothetical protein